MGIPRDRVVRLERRNRFEQHVEGISSLRRETPTHIALELPVQPGETDTSESIEAWRRAVERIRADRVLVVPAPGAEGPLPLHRTVGFAPELWPTVRRWLEEHLPGLGV